MKAMLASSLGHAQPTLPQSAHTPRTFFNAASASKRGHKLRRNVPLDIPAGVDPAKGGTSPRGAAGSKGTRRAAREQEGERPASLGVLRNPVCRKRLGRAIAPLLYYAQRNYAVSTVANS
jgi:hypothetical protein